MCINGFEALTPRRARWKNVSEKIETVRIYQRRSRPRALFFREYRPYAFYQRRSTVRLFSEKIDCALSSENIDHTRLSENIDRTFLSQRIPTVRFFSEKIDRALLSENIDRALFFREYRPYAFIRENRPCAADTRSTFAHSHPLHRTGGSASYRNTDLLRSNTHPGMKETQPFSLLKGGGWRLLLCRQQLAGGGAVDPRRRSSRELPHVPMPAR